LWIVWQMVSMCLGRHRVGFCSGRAFRETNEQVERPWYRRRTQRVRIVYLIFGTIYVIAAFLMVTKGVLNLQSSVNRLTAASVDVDNLSGEAQRVISEGLQGAVRDLLAVRSEIVSITQPQELCQIESSLTDSSAGRALLRFVDDAVESLGALDDVPEKTLQDLADAFGEVERGGAQVEDYTEEVDLTGWQTGLTLSIYSLVPTLLMTGVIFSAFQIQPLGYQCLVDWFILPLFVITTVIAVVVAVIMAFAAALNADFCLPGGEVDVNAPDETIRRVLVREGYDSNSSTFQIVDFYIRQCQQEVSTTPASNVVVLEAALQAATTVFGDLVESLRSHLDGISGALFSCGGDIRALNAAMINMATAFENARLMVIDFIALTRCETIVPVYLAAVHDGMCLYSSEATAWIFGAGITMALCGMVMISLRSAHKITRLQKESMVLIDVMASSGVSDASENAQSRLEWASGSDANADAHTNQIEDE